MKRLRVVVDANVLAPGLVSQGSASAEIVRLWRRGIFDVLIAGKLVSEVARTILALGFESEDAVELIEILGANVDPIIPLKHQQMGCADPEDDYLLELSLTGKAAIIVSRDKHVLNLPKAVEDMLRKHDIRIMSDVEFLNYVRGNIFSPFMFRESYSSDEIIGPLETPCVLCGHGFHWDFPCGEIWGGPDGEVECSCFANTVTSGKA